MVVKENGGDVMILERMRERRLRERRIKKKRLWKENHDGHTNRDSNSSDVERTESEQKRLEIELRNKVLESLRMKKAISH